MAAAAEQCQHPVQAEMYTEETLRFCQALPKVELHAHLNGSIRDATIRHGRARRLLAVGSAADSADVRAGCQAKQPTNWQLFCEPEQCWCPHTWPACRELSAQIDGSAISLPELQRLTQQGAPAEACGALAAALCDLLHATGCLWTSALPSPACFDWNLFLAP